MKMRPWILSSLIITFGLASVPAFAEDAPEDGKRPPRPSCSYANGICTISSPRHSFTVNTLDGAAPTSLEDCKQLPPCNDRPHRRPPRGDRGRDGGDDAGAGSDAGSSNPNARVRKGFSQQ